MPQKLLQSEDITTVTQELHCCRLEKAVRVDFFHAGGFSQLIEQVDNLALGKGTSIEGQENVVHVWDWFC